MNKEDEPLDTELMSKYANELVLAITNLITSRPKSKEMSGAAVAALAQVLVIVSSKLVGSKQAVDIISLAISHAFETTTPIIEKLIREQDTNTKTPRS